MNIFDYDHIFVVFAAGSGGNFVAGLLYKLSTNDLSPLIISDLGSSHSISNGKKQGQDSISFGTNREENKKFSDLESREKFYLDKIIKDYKDSVRIITWSHDYSNLPLYKKNFKNCTTFTITCLTPEEKLISVLMHVNKVILSNENDVPIPTEIWNFLKNRLYIRVKENLEKIFGSNIDSKFIFDNREDEKFKDLVFYLSSVILLNYAGLSDVLSLINEPIRNLSPTDNPREFIINNSDIILPYRYLRENKKELLLNSISKTFKRSLSPIEEEFITRSFNEYRNKQEILLLENPFEYFYQRKNSAINKIKEIKQNHEYYFT